MIFLNYSSCKLVFLFCFIISILRLEITSLKCYLVIKCILRLNRLNIKCDFIKIIVPNQNWQLLIRNKLMLLLLIHTLFQTMIWYFRDIFLMFAIKVYQQFDTYHVFAHVYDMFHQVYDRAHS